MVTMHTKSTHQARTKPAEVGWVFIAAMLPMIIAYGRIHGLEHKCSCENGLVCCFLCHSNSISVISWQWYDIWDRKEKARAYFFNNSRNLYPPTPYRHGMRGTGFWWCCIMSEEMDCSRAKWYCSDWIYISVLRVTNPRDLPRERGVGRSSGSRSLSCKGLNPPA